MALSIFSDSLGQPESSAHEHEIRDHPKYPAHMTPLILASLNDDVEMVKILMVKGHALDYELFKNDNNCKLIYSY